MRRDVPAVSRSTARPGPPTGRAVPRSTFVTTNKIHRTLTDAIPARPRSFRRTPDPGPAEVVLEIPGKPVSKERPRFNTKTGRAYTPGKTKDAEEVVRWHAKLAGLKVDRHSLFSVDFVFFCEGQRKRDNDNMQKLVQDALNKIVWWDDSQVRRSSVDVIYGSSQPRSVITIRRLDAADLAAMQRTAHLDVYFSDPPETHPDPEEQ